MKDFDFWVEDDRIRVRYVSRRALGRLRSGHGLGGDYGNRLIRLPRYEGRRTLRGALLHEIGHYLVERDELNPRSAAAPLRDVTEEEVADLFAWLPGILFDDRNADLRAALGLKKEDE